MLDELRKKPRAVRTLYAFWGALGITAVISFFWVVSLIIRLDSVDTKKIEEVGEATGAFSQFLEKSKDRLFGRESVIIDEPDSNDTTTVSTTSPRMTTSTTTRTNIVPLIATTTPEKVQVGTSSRVAN